MNWDRRAFVKFALGAVVGIHASPLVYKLMDDVAIWTQNWSWVPVPENGELAFAATANPATGTACRARIVKARITGERLIRVEGNFDHPLCAGGVVAADASAIEMAYDDACRVTAPMLRHPKSGLRSKVSADQAMDYIAGKLKALAQAGRPHQLGMVVDDPDSITGELMMRFAAAYGTPNLVGLPRAGETLAMAGRLMLGQEDIGFDLINSDCVISFGTPLLEGFGAPVQTRKAFAAWQTDNAAMLIQVEPRASISSSQADMWLACKPGTEGAVALGLCQILVQRGAYDRGLTGLAMGFADMSEGPGFKSLLAKEYTPAQVEKISGVPAKKLAAVAEVFIRAKRPVAVCGRGNAGDPGRLYDFMSVLALNCLRGNLGKPGGVVLRKPLPLQPVGPALNPPSAPALTGTGLLGAGSLQAMAEASLAGQPYTLGALIVAGCNPGYAWPQAGGMARFLESVPFIVSISPWMDETAAMADVVLPAGTFLESWGDVPTPYGSPQASYGLHRPLVKIYNDAKSAGDWVLMLSQAIGGAVSAALPFDTASAALAARVADLGDLKKLAEKGFWVQDKPAYGSLPIKTESGQVEFFSSALHKALVAAGDPKKAGVTAGGSASAMPHYEPPAETPEGEYPLLMAAIPSMRTGDGTSPISPYMVKVLDNTTLAHKDQLVVEINPETAHKLHLREGSAVEIESAAGGFTALVHLYHGAAPGVVFVPMNLGHAALDEMYIKGKGKNFFSLAGVSKDPVSGQPLWEYTPVAIKGASHV